MVTDIVGAFTDTITALFQGLGSGIIDLFETLIYNDVDGLSPLGTWMLVFMGFSFAIAIFYGLFGKVA
jgi:hypothetical protein